jgi:Pyridoxamine 5'-phosphate oxidase
MHETPQDIAELDELLQRSIEQAGPFLRSSFEMPEKSLSAAQLCRALDRIQTIAIATVTAKGEPRVAPIGAFLYRGHFYIPTTMESARVRHVRRRPGVSLTRFDGIDFAVIVHGEAAVLGEEDPVFATLEGIHRELTGSTVLDWGTGAFIRVEAYAFYTFARYPDQFSS